MPELWQKQRGVI